MFRSMCITSLLCAFSMAIIVTEGTVDINSDIEFESSSISVNPDIQKSVAGKARTRVVEDMQVWIEDILEEEVAEKAEYVLANELSTNVYKVDELCFNHTKMFVKGLATGEMWAFQSK